MSTVHSLLDVICSTTGMGFAAIARVTNEKWVACAVHDEIAFGLQSGSELPLETTICNEIRQSMEVVVIDHVAEDANFAYHPTPLMYGFQSYISVPIKRKDGTFFGTLCAIDPRPARVNTPSTVAMFQLFADLISFHLNAVEELSVSHSKLVEERKIAELRDQFIAILGHDLRNPLAAVINVAQIFMRMPLDERMMRLASLLHSSSFRMKELIENVMDFAQGKMGEGITVTRKMDDNLEESLNQVIAELQVVWPDQVIHVNFDAIGTVNCDSKRIAQLFSNLLSNAINHGKRGSLIKVKCELSDKEFTLSVANEGVKISEEIKKYLFQPFSRGNIEPRKQGLGLGLYISAEIAKAHGGAVSVTSTNEETEFVLQIPV